LARPREFDTETAVEKAMEAFWTHGYNGTSLPDLLEAMGITRGSLYKAFGSKKELFLKTLALYDDLHVKPAESILQSKLSDGEERLASVFNGAVSAVEQGDRRGCLLCNTSAGASSEDNDIAGIVSGQLNRLTNAFAKALRDTKLWGNQSEKSRMAEARSKNVGKFGLAEFASVFMRSISAPT